ncbi:MAG TPA: spermidine/putrescine ABC transporter substrate-binding protein [Acidimicrobiia bacterium]|nr:spermidine/putrescine ABC transporter substrate-binding protein [Acidimicrobiia bacterium]
MRQRSKWLALVVALAMTLAACGDDTTPDTTDGGTDTTAPGGGSTETTMGEGAECALDETDGDLNFYNWSEYMDPDLITAFEEQYGVDVVETFYDSNETMLAQIQAGVVYDLIVPSDYMVNIMIEEGLLLPLAMDAVPNVENLGDQFVNLPYDPDGAYSVAYQWGTTGLGVDISVVGEDFEPSWALVFDPDLTAGYPNGVSLLNDPRETIGAALKYLGYGLNETSEEALQEAADLIRAANVTTFDSDQYTDNLVNGEVAVSHGYSGNYFAVFFEVENPDNYAYVIPEEGATLWTDNMAIPANADHPCTAHTFINYIMDAENGAQLTNWTYYASPNQAAEESILPEILEDTAIYPDDATFEKLEAIEDTGDEEILFTDYFNIAKGG